MSEQPREAVPMTPEAGPDSTREEAWRRLPRTVALTLAWAVTAVLAATAVGRVTHLDGVLWPYAAVNALTPVLYLPAYPALAVAVLTRRRALGALAIAVAATQFVWVCPEIWPGGVQRAAAGAVRLRLLTANVEYDNPTAGRLADQIRRQSPDLVLFEELSPLTLAGLTRTGILGAYRYQVLRPQDDGFGSGVLARFPLTDVQGVIVGGFLSLRVTVHPAADSAFRLFVVHTIAPRGGREVRIWRTQLADLRREAGAVALPVVAAGDFNATRDDRPFRALSADGLRDAHDAAHAGWTPTWTTKTGILPPLFRLDHVLTTRDFAVTSYHVGTAYGSDHLPLVVDLALSPRHGAR
jgi:endonuclease/exonuclease/phosphatase family metal-dependent hydrolase